MTMSRMVRYAEETTIFDGIIVWQSWSRSPEVSSLTEFRMAIRPIASGRPPRTKAKVKERVRRKAKEKGSRKVSRLRSRRVGRQTSRVVLAVKAKAEAEDTQGPQEGRPSSELSARNMKMRNRSPMEMETGRRIKKTGLSGLMRIMDG